MDTIPIYNEWHMHSPSQYIHYDWSKEKMERQNPMKKEQSWMAYRQLLLLLKMTMIMMK